MDVKCAMCGEPWSYRGLHWTSSDLNWLASWDMLMGRGCPSCGGVKREDHCDDDVVKYHMSIDRSGEGMPLLRNGFKLDKTPGLEPISNERFDLDWLIEQAIEHRRELASDFATEVVAETIAAALVFPKKNGAKYRQALWVVNEDPERPGRLQKDKTGIITLTTELELDFDSRTPFGKAQQAVWNEWLARQAPLVRDSISERPRPHDGREVVHVDFAVLTFGAGNMPCPAWQDVYGFRLHPLFFDTAAGMHRDAIGSQINRMFALVDELNQLAQDGVETLEGFAEAQTAFEDEEAQESRPEALIHLFNTFEEYGLDLRLIVGLPQDAAKAGFDTRFGESEDLLQQDDDDRTAWKQPAEKLVAKVVSLAMRPLGWRFFRARHTFTKEGFLAIPLGMEEPSDLPAATFEVRGIWLTPGIKIDELEWVTMNAHEFKAAPALHELGCGHIEWDDLPEWVRVTFVEWAKEEG